MGGQVLGGGVIVLVSVLLWLVYLLPSWYGRRQYDASERNAVRLNQALRVLAETSETPQEVRLELNTRTALAQQKLARRAVAEREQASLEHARTDLEQARIEREQARLARVAARATPQARQARARRRFRLATTIVGAAALVVAAWGGVQVVVTGSQLMLWIGVGVAVLSALMLNQMSRVGARAVVRTEEAVTRAAAPVQDVTLESAPRQWAPRQMPRPLTASVGSRAAAVLDAEAAREALRLAAIEEDMRQRAEAERPPSIETARTAQVAAATPAAPAASTAYARMGYVDDAEIEAHVRDLLTRRAVGQ